MNYPKKSRIMKDEKVPCLLLWDALLIKVIISMTFEYIGWFMISAGLSMLIIGIAALFYTIIRRRMIAANNQKLVSFIERLKSEADLIKDKIEKDHKIGREISELVFRDKEGILNTVRIVIDHGLDDLSASDQEELKGMVLKEKGTPVDLVSGHDIT